MTTYRRATIAWGVAALAACSPLPWERAGKDLRALWWPHTGLTRTPAQRLIGRVGLTARLTRLFAVTLGIVFLQPHWLGHRSYVTATGKPSSGQRTRCPLGLDLASTARFLVSPGHGVVTLFILSWAEHGAIGRGAALSTPLILVLAGRILPGQRLARCQRFGQIAGMG